MRGHLQTTSKKNTLLATILDSGFSKIKNMQHILFFIAYFHYTGKSGEADENFSQYSRYSDKEFPKLLEITVVFLRDFC